MMQKRIEMLSAAVGGLEKEVHGAAAATAELARQVSSLAMVIDALARAELARANATNMNTQMTRAMASDLLHIKDRLEFVAANTEPLQREVDIGTEAKR